MLNNATTRARSCGGWLFVDDDLVKNLANLVRVTNAKVVLSSTWRMDWDKEHPEKTTPDFIQFREKLAEFGIELLDRTGDWEKFRSIEINKWLSQWEGERIENFVIIDDWTDMGNLRDHLILTNPIFGLTEELAMLAAAFLNGDEE